MWRKPNSYEQAQADTLDKFDPNTTPEHRFATFIPRREPGFKIHRDRGPALSAISGHNNAILYEREDNGRWNEIFRVQLGNLKDRCEDCGHKVVPDPKGRIGWTETLRMVWVRQGSKIVHPPAARFVCVQCARHYR